MSSKMARIVCPIPDEHLVPDQGRVGDYGGFSHDEYNKHFYEYNVGEIFDVCCVARGTKFLAAMDLVTDRSLEFLCKNIETEYYDSDMYNRVIRYINSIQLPSFQWTNPKGNYLRCIYYNPEIKGSIDNALKLILVLQTDYFDNPDGNDIIEEVKYHTRIGHLLGYPMKRIAGYMYRNINYEDVIDDIKGFIGQKIHEIQNWAPICKRNHLSKWSPTEKVQELMDSYGIIHQEGIPEEIIEKILG